MEHRTTASTSWRNTRWSRIFIVFVMLFVPLAHAESEYAVKAAYLNNFAKMVKWPASAFANPQAPLVIGVVGRDPFGGLDGVLRGQMAGNRNIEVRRVGASDAAGLQTCHLVYVNASERVANVARAVQGHPVLVVAETEDAAREGGIIAFVMQERKLKLEINNAAARQVRINIPSDILEMARIVK
jgi:hypothetical protein